MIRLDRSLVLGVGAAIAVTLGLSPTPARAEDPPPVPARQCNAHDGTEQLPPGVACMGLSFDLRSVYRGRSTRQEVFAEAQRDAAGPGLELSLGRIRPERPIARLLLETRAFLDARIGTAAGDIEAVAGLRAQYETPPRRPDDRDGGFRRTGRRVLLERASIEFDGLAVGYMTSAFYFAPGLTYTTAYAAEQNGASLRFHYPLASDIQIIASLEDGSKRRLVDEAWGVYRPGRSYDAVLAVNRAFSWGNIRVAAAHHPIRAEARAPCCNPVASRATGGAAMAGLESWFETPLGSAELVVNISTAKGALDYLNATNYPADFAVEADGRVRTAHGIASVFAVANSWNRFIRTILSISGVRSTLGADQFRLRNSGIIAQTAFEYRPGREALLGLEVNYHHDKLNDGSGPTISNGYVSAVLYFRQRLRVDLGQVH